MIGRRSHVDGPKEIYFLAKALLIKINGTVLSIYESDFLGPEARSGLSGPPLAPPVPCGLPLSVFLVLAFG